MKVIAIPALHLDKKYNVTYGSAQIWADKPLQLIKAIIRKERPDKILFLGDIFNTSHPSFHSIFNFLLTVKKYNVSVISGNHDIPKTDKKSVMDYIAKYVHVISHNDIDKVYSNMYAIGWCDTQRLFEAKLKATIEHTKGDHIFLHAGYNNWDNEMDNVVTDSLIKKAKLKNIKLISGHEHISNIVQDTLFHTGAIMPMNIGELGKKFYWTSTKGLKLIDHKVGTSLTQDDVILCRIEPQNIENYPEKCIQVKTNKPTQTSDLKLVEKELTIDILEDFTKEAIKNGFDENFITELMD